MTVQKSSLQGRIEELSAQLQALQLRVDQLESFVGAPALQQPAPPAALPEPARQAPPQEEPEEDVSEEIINWAGKAHLLTRLSTLCFLLVVALILRTLTDSNMIGTMAGSVLGMGYAAALMLWGTFGYERKNPLAPVLACCGAVLMSVIVVETHSRFAALPLVPAYLTLIVTGGWMAFLSYRHRAFLPISLGTLGMCLAGAAIDYPNPFFPYLAMVLFAANILGYFAAKLKSCSWLRWIVLIVTMTMLQLWGVKLGQVLLHGGIPTPELAAPWFIPTLAAFTILYLSIACAGIIRSRDGKMSLFDQALPTLNALWSFSAAYYAIHASGGSKALLGGVGMAVAAGYLAITVWLSGRKVAGAPGTNSFAFASAALSAAALPVLTGSFLYSLPALSVVAFFMAILSRHWGNGGIRFTSYLMEIYASLGLLLVMLSNPLAAGHIVNALPALLLATITLYHYQWCRRYPPPSPSIFSRFDASDRSAVLLLIAALTNGFFTVKMVLLQTLTLYAPAAAVANAQHCGESVLINASAAGMMLVAFMRNNKELRNVAILILVVGAVRVFLYDLFQGNGIPLVISMFTFGMAALLQSVALGRWQKRHRDKGGEVADHGAEVEGQGVMDPEAKAMEKDAKLAEKGGDAG